MTLGPPTGGRSQGRNEASFPLPAVQACPLCPLAAELRVRLSVFAVISVLKLSSVGRVRRPRLVPHNQDACYEGAGKHGIKHRRQ